MAAAKQAHFAAHAEARVANNVPQAAPAYAPAAPAYAPNAYAQAAPAYAPVAASLKDGETYPAAEPYYHQEIPAGKSRASLKCWKELKSEVIVIKVKPGELSQSEVANSGAN